ncbi:unnamed protein product [Rhizophagus irregularis]|nr:unnamed protein product [Rhizophagus irregularis]CAB5114893.1 unnamed protein product [Rhizophagus irregularis]
MKTNKGDTYYWCCEKKRLEKCKGRATTIFLDGKHYLKNFVDHHHSPQASKVKVAKTVAQIKQQARETRDKPVQIIQNNIINMSQDDHPYMPSKNALRTTIKRVRRAELPPQPQNIGELNVPNPLCLTLNGDPFLVKDLMVGTDRILLFTTQMNIQRLSQAQFWLMDGTFRTVPTIFCQLYTIHAPVGSTNSRILPLIYALITSKTEQIYRCLFEEIVDFAAEHNIILQPSTILTDFEQASIYASRYVFPNARNKGCFFHLGQSGWRKIQSCGLAIRYGNDEQYILKYIRLFALAFLPSQEIPDAFDTLKLVMPQEANIVTQWFEENYVRGKIRQHLRNGSTTRSAPLFPPSLWSVYDSMETGVPRTQNVAEAWHHRWNTLVGQSHAGIYTIIKELQKEQ